MPDEVELPAQVDSRCLHRHQAAAAEGVAQGQARDAADAEARLHRALDRLGVFQLQANVQRGRVVAHGLVEGQPCTRAAFAEDPGLPAQFLQAGLTQ
ncbi:hypothetical protein D9M68_642980 [compost metagenome]